MALATRSVRRSVGDTSGFDSAAATYIRAVQDADGAALEPAVAFAINSFVLGCKADGIWDAIKAACILMGARTLSGALTALVGSNPTNNGPFVSGDYSRKNGLLGNGSTKYLDSNRNSNADGQDDAHMCVYVHTAASNSATQAYIGAGGGDPGSTQINWVPSLTAYYFRNRNSTLFSQSSSSQTGFIGMSRAASSSYTSRLSGVDTTRTQSSQTTYSGNVYVFCRNLGGAGTYCDARMQWYSIGSSLTMSSLDSRLATLASAIGAAIP